MYHGNLWNERDRVKLDYGIFPYTRPFSFSENLLSPCCLNGGQQYILRLIPVWDYFIVCIIPLPDTKVLVSLAS